MQVIHDPVDHTDMHAFDHAHVVQGHVDARLSHLREFAAAEARHAESGQAVTVGPIDRGQHVGAVPDPLIATSRSPGWPKFISCWTKIWS